MDRPECDDIIRRSFREIRQSYHSAVNEWGVGDQKAMIEYLRDAEIRTHELIGQLGEENGRSGKIPK